MSNQVLQERIRTMLYSTPITEETTEINNMPLKDVKLLTIDFFKEVIFSPQALIEEGGYNSSVIDSDEAEMSFTASSFSCAMTTVQHNMYVFGKDKEIDFIESRIHWLEAESVLYPEMEGKSPYEKIYAALLKINEETMLILQGKMKGYSFKPVAQVIKTIYSIRPDYVLA